jgi:hypothetical protein
LSPSAAEAKESGSAEGTGPKAVESQEPVKLGETVKRLAALIEAMCDKAVG